MRQTPLLVLLFAVACGAPATPATANFPAAVGAAGGTLKDEVLGVTLEIPAGALTSSVTFDVEPMDDEVTLAPGSSFVGSGFRFSPSGQTFAKPVKVTLPASQSKLDDFGVTIDSCLMWVRQASGSFSQQPAVAHTETTVTSETTVLIEAAVGAKFQYTIAPPANAGLGAPCTSPSGFCVTSLPQGLKRGATSFSTISPQGRLHYRFSELDAGGTQVAEFSVVSGTHVAISAPFVPPSTPVLRLHSPVDAMTVRVAVSDAGVLVPIHGRGLVRFPGAATPIFTPNDPTLGGTIGVVVTPSGARLEQLLSSPLRTSEATLRVGVSSTPTGALRIIDAQSVEPDFLNYDFLQIGQSDRVFEVAQRHPTSSVLEFSVTASDAGVPVPQFPGIPERQWSDQVAMTADGSLLAQSTVGFGGSVLRLQSRDGSISRVVNGLPNLNALEFGEPGFLYATSTTAPHVYRIDVATGALQTILLTNATDPAEVQPFSPVALRYFSVPTAGVDGLYVLTGSSTQRRLMLVRRAP
ncbi:MAG: hypothetical protein GQE15_17115 [Archangiaceae bacterium]|nr:hypothetical protein [Archangiaceae bacterium]